jgi:hypothetical protein
VRFAILLRQINQDGRQFSHFAEAAKAITIHSPNGVGFRKNLKGYTIIIKPRFETIGQN